MSEDKCPDCGGAGRMCRQEDNCIYIHEIIDCPTCKGKGKVLVCPCGCGEVKPIEEVQPVGCPACGRIENCAGNDSGRYPCPDFIPKIKWKVQPNDPACLGCRGGSVAHTCKEHYNIVPLKDDQPEETGPEDKPRDYGREYSQWKIINNENNWERLDKLVGDMQDEIDRLRAEIYKKDYEAVELNGLGIKLGQENLDLYRELRDTEMHLGTFRDERDALMEQNKTFRAERDIGKKFHDLAVSERDYERVVNDRLKKENEALKVSQADVDVRLAGLEAERDHYRSALNVQLKRVKELEEKIEGAKLLSGLMG